MSACQTLPRHHSRSASTFIAQNENTSLYQGFRAFHKLNAPKMAVVPLSSGLDALQGRMALIRSAEQSLDLQYYIWHNDRAGRLLLASLLEAADRGVRVRLLLDEIHGDNIADPLRALREHPRIEVRLFNPFHNRSIKSLDFVTRFSEANRRMHNKAMVVDNAGAVIGGRNIGDEYFEISEEQDLGDFDLIVLGPAVTEVSKNFDLFWNHDWAVPIEIAYPEKPRWNLTDLRAQLADHLKSIAQTPFANALQAKDFLTELRENKWPLYPGNVVVLADTPAKFFQSEYEAPVLLNHVADAMGEANKEVFIITPYFVPGTKGVEVIKKAVDRGVQVRVLTNSLASNDVSWVHAGYKNYRLPLLKAGTELYEMKPVWKKVPNQKKRKLFSSRSGLHGKVYFFDHQKMFVGSMNMDPRSFYLNTEMGVVVESPQMISSILSDIKDRLSETAYQVRLDEKENLIWEIQASGQKQVETKEPEATWWQRWKNWMLTPFVPEYLL